MRAEGATARSRMQPPDLLERSLFITRFGQSDVTNQLVKRLHALASSAPSDSIDTSVEWLEDMLGWLFERGKVPGRLANETELQARTRVLLELLTESDVVRERARSSVSRVLGQTTATRLFTDTGLPTHSGFWRELLDRFGRQALPEPPVGRDFSRFVTRLVSSKHVAVWLSELPHAIRHRFSELLGLSQLTRLLQPAMNEAALLLAARLAMLGTSDDVRRRAPSVSVAESPFLALQAHLPGALDASLPLSKVDQDLTKCRELLGKVHAALEATGISIDLVFRLELMAQSLTRLEQLLHIARGTEAQSEPAWLRLERSLIQGALTDRSLIALLRSNTNLLARRVVERAGDAGEHYMTRTRSEQHEMLGAAGGGGAVTAVMVLLKFVVTWARLPPLFDALALGVNYGVGFVTMQLAHFTLATKQPSMTAAALAGAIANQNDTDFEPLVDQVTRASRTQLFALIGNVGIVIPVAAAVELLVRAVTGHHVLDQPYAQHLVEVHHPWRSATVIHAAVTGVWLWAASLMAGAVENWFVLREMPGAIASNRDLRRLIGGQRAAQLARFMRHNISGFGGNFGFGLLLGIMPFLFHMVGIPLEVRHVTFVAGQLTYAAMSLGPWVTTEPDFLWSLLSIPVVGLINFAVSFALAMIVALNARGKGIRDQAQLALAVWRRLLTRPGEFILAPKTVVPESPKVAAEPAA